MASQVRRRGMLVVVAIAALSIAAVPGSAAGAKLKVKVRDNNLGKVWDSKRAKVKVKPKRPGKAKVTVVAFGAGNPKKIATARKTVKKRGATVAAKVTKKGRKALTNCAANRLTAKVVFKFKGGGRAGAGDTRAAKQTFALCSQGSEDPQQRPYYGPRIPGLGTADRCDALDPSVCLYPFPNDHFTVEDGASDTGKRINLDQASMPQNTAGTPPNQTHTPIDPTDYNRADGFSPGSPIVFKIPGLDNPEAMEETGGVPLTDMGAFDDPEQAIVLINAETGERHPIWTEIDSQADSNADRALYIRPAANLDYGTRYIVALRNLKDSAGNPIDPGLAFRAYRDRLTTGNAGFESRRNHMEGLFDDLQDASIPRANLNLAWDFTVASDQGIAGRSLAMRADAFEQLGDEDLGDMVVEGDAPEFTIDSVTNFEPCTAGDPGVCEEGESDFFARRIEGEIDTPCYLDQNDCPPGAQFAFDDAGDLEPNFDPEFRIEAGFTCNVPRPALDDEIPARPSLYGHGLLGQHTEVNGSSTQTMALSHNILYCATDWVGFSQADFVVAAQIVQDLSNLPKLVDRTQQSFIDFMYLGRAMIHPDGFASDEAFQDGEGDPVFDGSELFYDGNSQGGILGGALTALTPDYERAVLGVPAINYSNLLERARPFFDLPFFALLDQNYPNKLERPLLFSLMQTLWDRGEPNGYAAHMTSDPLPDTPEHTVLLQVALGDFQVSDYAAEVEARTIGAAIEFPSFDPGRYWGAGNVPFGIPEIESFPYGGSAIQYWDGGPVGFVGTFGNGTGLPPIENLPPAAGPVYGSDPHSYPRRTPAAQQEKSDFYEGAINGCGGPCRANGHVGP